MPYGYLWAVREHDRRYRIDSWIDVTPFLKENLVPAVARAKMLGTPPPTTDYLSQDIHHMSMRVRINNCVGPCLVRTDEPLSCEEFEDYINAMSVEEFHEFARKSKFV